jgi:hypothetical protein
VVGHCIDHVVGELPHVANQHKRIVTCVISPLGKSRLACLIGAPVSTLVLTVSSLISRPREAYALRDLRGVNCPMSDGYLVDILALVPMNMQSYMGELAAAVPGHVRRFISVEEMVHDFDEAFYASSSRGAWALFSSSLQVYSERSSRISNVVASDPPHRKQRSSKHTCLSPDDPGALLWSGGLSLPPACICLVHLTRCTEPIAARCGCHIPGQDRCLLGMIIRRASHLLFLRMCMSLRYPPGGEDLG